MPKLIEKLFNLIDPSPTVQETQPTADGVPPLDLGSTEPIPTHTVAAMIAELTRTGRHTAHLVVVQTMNDGNVRIHWTDPAWPLMPNQQINNQDTTDGTPKPTGT